MGVDKEATSVECVLIVVQWFLYRKYMAFYYLMKLLTFTKGVKDAEDESNLVVVMSSFSLKLLLDLICIIETMILIYDSDIDDGVTLWYWYRTMILCYGAVYFVELYLVYYLDII